MLTGFVSISSQQGQTFYAEVQGQHSTQDILDAANRASEELGLDVEFNGVHSAIRSAAVTPENTLDLGLSADIDVEFDDAPSSPHGTLPNATPALVDNNSDASSAWDESDDETPDTPKAKPMQILVDDSDMAALFDEDFDEAQVDDQKDQPHTIPKYSEQRQHAGPSQLSQLKKQELEDVLHYGLSHDNAQSQDESAKRKQAYDDGTAAISQLANFLGYDLEEQGALDAKGLDALIKEFQSDDHVMSGAIHAQRYGGITDRIPNNIINQEVVTFLGDKAKEALGKGDDESVSPMEYQTLMTENHFSNKSIAQRCQGAILRHLDSGKEFIYHLDGLDEQRLQTIAESDIGEEGSITDLELNFLSQNWDSEVFGVAINADTVKFMKGGDYVDSPFE